MRSPARSDSPPPGSVSVVAADDPEHAGVARQRRLPQRAADDRGIRAFRHVELDDLHLSVREDVGLARRGHADRARHGVGGLELGRHREVDVEPPLAPEVDVLDVGRPDDRGRAGRLDPCERAGDEVHLVARRARDEEVSLADARVAERLATGAVRLDRADVVPVGEWLEPLTDDVDHREVVLVVERLHDGGSDLPRADDHDPHARRRVSGSAMDP